MQDHEEGTERSLLQAAGATGFMLFICGLVVVDKVMQRMPVLKSIRRILSWTEECDAHST